MTTSHLKMLATAIFLTTFFMGNPGRLVARADFFSDFNCSGSATSCAAYEGSCDPEDPELCLDAGFANEMDDWCVDYCLGTPGGYIDYIGTYNWGCSFHCQCQLCTD